MECQQPKFYNHLHQKIPMKNYCALPFGHLCADTMGRYQICCQHSVPAEYQNSISDTTPVEWFKNEYLNQVRQAFEQDIRHPGCASCWRTEDSGKQSLRQRVSQEYKILGSKTCEPKLVNVEIQAGNLCNLSCVMCNEQESSGVLAENQRLGINLIQQSDVKWDDQAWINFQQILQMKPKVLNIRGGEPFYNKKLLEIVESMTQEQCDTMLLHITTNGTMWSQRWRDALRRFKLVRIMLSIDGTNDVYEYIRYPGQWNTLNDNVEQMLIEPNLKLMVHTVVQNLNVSRLKDITAWCQKRNLFLQFYKCNTPAYLEPTNLPDQLIDSTISHLQSCLDLVTEPNAQSFVQSTLNDFVQRKHKGIDTQLWNEFVKYMTMRESIRGNSYLDILNYKS